MSKQVGRSAVVAILGVTGCITAVALIGSKSGESEKAPPTPITTQDMKAPEKRAAAPPVEAPAPVAETETKNDQMTGPPKLRHPDTSDDQLSGDQAMAAEAVLKILHRVDKPCVRIMWVQPDPNIENTFDVACRTNRSSKKEVAYIVEPVTGVVGHL